MLAAWALAGCLPEGAPPWQVDHAIAAAIRFDVATRGPYSSGPARPDRSVAEIMPGDAIRMTPFLVGPDGPIDLTAAAPAWFYCNSSRCFDAVAQPTPVTDCVVETLPPAATCKIGEGATPTLRLGELTALRAMFNDPPAVMMVAGAPDGPSTRLCLERLAKLAEDPETLQACVIRVEPLPLGPLWRILLLAVVLELPDAVDLDGISPPVQSAETSMYPEVLPFALTIVGVDGTARERLAVSGDRVVVAPGETVVIDAPVNPVDAQLYYLPYVNNRGSVSVQAQFEAFNSSWLFSRAIAEPSLAVQQITWQVPEEAVEPIHSYYLLSDGRSIVWAWLRFEVVADRRVPGA